MRNYRPRFTVGCLIVAVAIVGLALGCLQWIKRRHELFRSLTKHHALAWKNSPTVLGDDQSIQNSERGEYHRKMWAKYYYAKYHPWLPVAPDPPEPK